MNPPPSGWPRLTSAVFYDDAPAAIDWLCEAFGFEVQLKVEGEGGVIIHSRLRCGDGLIMVSTANVDRRDPPMPKRSPRSVGGANTQSLMMYVDDADAHCAQARAAGAQILDEPETTDYGEEYWADRNYRAVDPEGHHWWFSQRVRSGPQA